MKILQDLDFDRNNAINLALDPLAAAPSTPVAGQVYFDTVLNCFRVYSGSVWQSMGASTSDLEILFWMGA